MRREKRVNIHCRLVRRDKYRVKIRRKKDVFSFDAAKVRIVCGGVEGELCTISIPLKLAENVGLRTNETRALDRNRVLHAIARGVQEAMGRVPVYKGEKKK